MNQSDPVAAPGYNQEDAHFAERDRELLEKKRAELDAARKQREADAAKAEYWMRCPKCGEKLTEQKMDVVMVDVCGGCGGVYFDRGEVKMLLDANRGGVLGALGKMFS